MSRPTLLTPALALALAACVPAQQAQGSPQKVDPAVPLATGCVPGYSRPDFTVLERDLAAARARWQAAGVRDYRYDFAQVAAPLRFPAVRVTVRGGAVASVERLPGESGEPSAQARGTVEARFADVAQVLRGQRKQACPVVEVEYDAQDGHPTRLYSGSGAANVADGWGEWRVTGFGRL